jgi:hypothetical protein
MNGLAWASRSWEWLRIVAFTKTYLFSPRKCVAWLHGTSNVQRGQLPGTWLGKIPTKCFCHFILFFTVLGIPLPFFPWVALRHVTSSSCHFSFQILTRK